MNLQSQAVAAPQVDAKPAIARNPILDHPFRSLADIENIERTPLNQRLQVRNFAALLDRAMAAREQTDTAIYFVPDGRIETEAETVSFAALRTQIARTSALLRANGVGDGDVVAILMPAVPPLFWSITAAMATGIAFPINWMLEAEHLYHLVTQSKAKAVIALGPTPGYRIWESVMSFAKDLPPGTPVWSVPGPGGTVLADSDLDTQANKQPAAAVEAARTIISTEIAAYLHSGGTTGVPKIIKLSHAGMSYRHWALDFSLRQEFGEVIIHDTPMFHSGGLTGRCMPPMASGASVLIPSPLGARDRTYIGNYWKFIEKYRVTRLSGVPTTIAVLAKAPPTTEDLTCLKPYFITGSTAMPVTVRKEFERDTGIRILNSYGMTENTASIAIDPRDGPPREGASGIRLPYVNIRVMRRDESGRVVHRCGPNEIGMLEISGAALTPGYVDPAHDRAARTDDNWLITGDLGRIDEDGYIYVTGRAKDVIIRGGHNIDPALIEEPLLKRPEVLHCAAVGKPDSYAGELPIAYVQLMPGAQTTSEALIAYLAKTITERAAVPKEVIVLDKMPLTHIGKPMKNVLRQQAAERTFGALLREATGAGERLRVAVEESKLHGTLLKITIECAAAEKEAAAGRIKTAMGSFATVYEIDWKEGAATPVAQ
jgi:fatty-acyl-CoA synthase